MKTFQTAIIVLVTLVAFVVLRFAFMPADLATHYHANFAVFIDGERLDLSADEYMEDVEGCKPDYQPLLPEERVHMHNNEDVVAHVHDEGVTWGHFFQNIGFTLSDVSLTTDTGAVYQNDRSRSLKFILNGEQVESISNQLVGNEDQLLISYGSQSVDQIFETQWTEIADNAHYHNEHPDPGSCSGEIDTGLWSKVRKAFWF